ncbi:MAG TPA: regulatory protein RecX [Aequorivita sp.]|nr:regulatory protein RecX [Aequorivita sp.]
MERYCAYQERCHKEVQQKLYQMRMIPEAIDHIINHLLQHNFLNETRFSQSFARGKFRAKKWGRIRIVRELKLREISQFNIKIALKEIPDSEYYQTFEALAEKRLQQLEFEKDIQKKRKKFADYLFYRGWESELVYAKVNDITV